MSGEGRTLAQQPPFPLVSGKHPRWPQWDRAVLGPWRRALEVPQCAWETGRTTPAVTGTPSMATSCGSGTLCCPQARHPAHSPLPMEGAGALCPSSSSRSSQASHQSLAFHTQGKLQEALAPRLSPQPFPAPQAPGPRTTPARHSCTGAARGEAGFGRAGPSQGHS